MTDASEWQGRVGDVWADEWQRTDRAFGTIAAALDAAILAAAPPGPLRAVDIGCGAAPTSLAFAAARPDARITGIDMSAALVAVARHRAADAHCANLDFIVGPAETAITAIAPVDLAFSRHGVMFFADPAAAFAAFRRAMAPGAPLIFSCFRAPAENPWAAATVTAMRGDAAAPPAPAPGYAPGPFAFADRAYVTDLLARSGWHDITATPVDYDFIGGIGDDPVADAASYFARIGPVSSALNAADAADRPAMLRRLSAHLAAHVRDGAVVFPAAAWLWSARAPAKGSDA